MQLKFSIAFDRVSNRGLLYKLRSICVGRQCLVLVLEILSDSRQCLRLDSKVIASVDVVSKVPQGSVLLSPSLFVLYICELFRIVGNNIVGHADNTTIYAVIPRTAFAS